MENNRSGSLGDADLAIELRETAGLTDLTGALTSLLERTPLTDRQRKDFRQAVLEMAANALEWGCGEGQKPWALVTCRVGPEDVTAIVQDRGPGFDPHSLADPLDPNRKCLSHGPGQFGIMLARGLVDIHSYNDRGNEVTLVKRFGPEAHG